MWKAPAMTGTPPPDGRPDVGARLLCLAFLERQVSERPPESITFVSQLQRFQGLFTPLWFGCRQLSNYYITVLLLAFPDYYTKSPLYSAGDAVAGMS